MAGMMKMHFSEVKEISVLPKATFEKIDIAGAEVYRYTFEPGWRWVEHAAWLDNSDSCLVPHVLFTISGQLAVQRDDGTTEEVGEGECIVIPPGHDAWTVGDNPYIGIDLGPHLYQRWADGANSHG